MASVIQRPSKLIGEQNRYGQNEVGVTHPTNSSYIKIADNGDIFLMCNPDFGIILNATRQSITFVGDSIKFVTKAENGLHWNELAFNDKATKYSEPTFLISKQPYASIYDDIDQFLD